MDEFLSLNITEIVLKTNSSVQIIYALYVANIKNMYKMSWIFFKYFDYVNQYFGINVDYSPINNINPQYFLINLQEIFRIIVNLKCLFTLSSASSALPSASRTRCSSSDSWNKNEGLVKLVQISWYLRTLNAICRIYTWNWRRPCSKCL